MLLVLVVGGVAVLKWNKKLILEKIEKLPQHNYKYVKVQDRCLVEAATRFFGSWKNAVEEFGLNYDDICDTHLQRKNNKKWNKENIIIELQRIYNSKEKASKPFRAVVRRYFGDFNSAVECAGLDKMYFSNVFGKDRVTREIKNLSGEELKRKNIKINNNKLFLSATHYFGSWAKALDSLGISYEKVKNGEVKDNVIKSIRKMKFKNDYYASKNYQSIYGNAVYHFGSWAKAVEIAGYNYNRIKNKFFSEEMVFDVCSKIFNNSKIIKHKRFSWLKNNETGRLLEVDFYIPQFKLAIEYQGRQHYEPVCFGGCSKEKAIENFEKQIYRDNIKRNKLRRHGVKLIEICYTESDIEQYIVGQIKRKRIKLNFTSQNLLKSV